MNQKRLLVTIDTEMDADIHWHKSWPPTFSSVTEGIPKYLRPIWDKYDVHPIYFVSSEVLYSEECCQVLRKEIEKGAVIGAHLHPEYIEPGKIWGTEIENVTPQFPNSAYETQIESEKIKNLTLLIQDKLGVTPTWYRGARFGADTDTIKILRKLGYQHDSSLTPNISWVSKGGPDHSRAPQECYPVSDDDIYGVNIAEENAFYEHPVTILGKRWGVIGKLFPNNWLFYVWLRPTHMTYLELKRILNKVKDRKELVMMFHSMEIMINKTPYVRNKWMQKYYLWRLSKSLEYARKEGFAL